MIIHYYEYCTRWGIFCNKVLHVELHFLRALSVPGRYMHLGIRLNNKFTFELHANECCRHVIHNNYILSKIRRYINVHQALNIYKCMILPYFCYEDIFMYNLRVKRYDRMQKLQNKALRVCLQRNNRSNVNSLHKDSNTNMLEDRRETKLICVTLCIREKLTKLCYRRDRDN